MQTTPPPPSAAAIFVLLLSPAAVSIVSAQMNGGGGGGGEENPNKYQPTTITPSMAIIIVVLIFAVFFMGIFSIYVRHCSDDGGGGGLPSTAGIRAAVGAAVRSRRDNQRGLPTDLLLSFPTFPYHQIKSLLFNKPSLECAVCLFEFQDDEKLKLLPNCNHVFHCECIDPWLSAHSTCPLCRSLLLLSDHRPPPPPSSSSAPHGGDHLNTTTPSFSHLPIPELQLSSAHPARLRLTRSHSTGHSLGRPPETRDRLSPETRDRFTLRLPEEVRERLLNRGTNRVWHREGSSRRGYRGGEESWRRYRRLDRPERGTMSDRWLLTAAPPFFSRVAAAATSESGRKTPVMVTEACLVAGGDGGGLGGPGFFARPPV